MDTGQIIAQEPIKIAKNDRIENLYGKQKHIWSLFEEGKSLYWKNHDQFQETNNLKLYRYYLSILSENAIHMFA